MYPIINKYIEKLMTSSPDAPLWNIESILNGKNQPGIILMDV